VRIELESNGGNQELTLHGFNDGDWIRLDLAGSGKDGSEIAAVYEFRAESGNSRIALRLDPQTEYRIEGFSCLGREAGLRLMETVERSRLRPVASRMADHAKRPTILL
jgi:hypothetical protein